MWTGSVPDEPHESDKACISAHSLGQGHQELSPEVREETVVWINQGVLAVAVGRLRDRRGCGIHSGSTSCACR